MVQSFDIQRIFSAIPGLFLVLQPDERFTILGASKDYLRASHTDASIFGRALFDVFPDNPADPQATGVRNLTASLATVMATGMPHAVAPQRYDVRKPDTGLFEERYWTAVNSPVLNAGGGIDYIIHSVEETTAKGMRESIDIPEGVAQKDIEAERRHLISESERQRRIYETALNSTPDFVYVFDLEHRALYANDALLKTWGVTDVRGKKWMDLGYEQWHADMHDRELDQVITTRAPIRGEIPFTGTGGTRVYDYIFAPVLDARGEVVAVAGTTRDITDRQAAEQSIREQAERLAASDRAKDEFLATLSHELRNPLAPLRNSIALLRRAGATDDRTSKIHTVMERQVNHLVRLVDDLLEVSRITHGELSLRKERIALADVVKNAIETSHPLIQAARHELVVDMPAGPLWLHGDPVRLAQVLSNLLNNASSYTEAGGHITVEVSRDDGEVAITIRDDGMGMEPAAIPLMFEMFSRGNRDSGRNQGGLGIGLALSRRLASMHGGTLEAHSEGPGKGAAFTVRLPLAELQGDARTVKAAEATALGRMRVLVVDDNVDAGDTMALVLDTLGAEVRVARGGQEALAVFADYRPSVVLLDIGMPGMNGYEVAEAIRTQFADHPVKLVALTGWGQEDDRRRAREAGFNHHVVKPAEIEALQQLLATLESA